MDEAELKAQFDILEQKQRQLILDRKALIDQKSAFYSQTATMTKKIERSEKLYDLAVKMKAQVDEERAKLEVEKKALTLNAK